MIKNKAKYLVHTKVYSTFALSIFYPILNTTKMNYSLEAVTYGNQDPKRTHNPFFRFMLFLANW